MHIKAYAAASGTSPLAPTTIIRRDPGPKDVAIDILYCGVCHSDVHAARGEWPGIMYPCVPGHEIIGRVVAVGTEASKFTVGQIVGVGCMVDSCRHCAPCVDGLEQYCRGEHGFIQTYNGGSKGHTDNTFGGYSAYIVVDQDFVLAVRHSETQLPAVAPLLCAGITTWSPLRHWHVGPGKRIGVVGIGGLGHMGVKLAHALGAYVVAFTTSESKREEARTLGADEVVVSRNPDEMSIHADSLDFILDTVAVSHDLDAYMSLLKLDGTMVVVGVPAEPHPSPAIANFIMGRRALAGSVIGGIRETQEMLDFCAEHGITSEVEIIAMADINEAFERVVKSDVKYRFVVDMGTLKGVS